MTDSYVRGQKIGFSTTFTDSGGAAVTPTGATLRIKYSVNGVSTTQSLAMTMVGAAAKYTWSSKVADAGTINWFIYPAGSSEAADEGSFVLKANAANLQNYTP